MKTSVHLDCKSVVPLFSLWYWIVGVWRTLYNYGLVITNSASDFSFDFAPHRLLHHPRLYKYVHKTHHEWTAPTGITALYCHPLEHFIANAGPLGLGPLIMGSHVSIACLWIVVAVVNTTISHSGYHLPFLPSSEAHDFHHLKSVHVLDYNMYCIFVQSHGLYWLCSPL